MKTCKGQNSVCKIKEQPAENFSPVGCGRTRSICKECVNKLARQERSDKKEDDKKKKRERVSYKKDVSVYGKAAQAMFSCRLV